MGLTKRTTVSFPQHLHEHLVRLARLRKVSVGQLVRSACERQYGFRSMEDRLQAVSELCRIGAPVASVAKMNRESVSRAHDLAW